MQVRKEVVDLAIRGPAHGSCCALVHRTGDPGFIDGIYWYFSGKVAGWGFTPDDPSSAQVLVTKEEADWLRDNGRVQYEYIDMTLHVKRPRSSVVMVQG